jgi:septal ring factor EnvC (AmiA/AmiB activator)
MLEKMQSGTSERVQVKDLNERIYVLEQQIREMESSNNKIRTEISRTNSNMGQYMREMNNLIDCHELSSVANMEVEQDSDEEENNRMLANRH